LQRSGTELLSTRCRSWPKETEAAHDPQNPSGKP
jgi:hypothetical protein